MTWSENLPRQLTLQVQTCIQMDNPVVWKRDLILGTQTCTVCSLANIGTANVLIDSTNVLLIINARNLTTLQTLSL
jgi:hypothetical protein